MHLSRIYRFGIMGIIVMSLAYAQTQPVRLSGVMDGNQVRTLIYNYGSIGRPVEEPSLEWPIGSGHGYAFEFGLIVGTRVENTNGEAIHVIDDGLIIGGIWNQDGTNQTSCNWEPVDGFVALDSNSSIARSDDFSTWPPVWGQWPGLTGEGVILADLESYYVMNDRYIARHANEYQAITQDTTYRGAGIQVGVRTYQWDSSDQENAILQIYDITNISDHFMDSVVVGMKGDPHIGGPNDYSDDNVGFYDQYGLDPITGDQNQNIANLIYCWDYDGEGGPEFGGDSVGLMAIHLLSQQNSDFIHTVLVPGYMNSGESELSWWQRLTADTINVSGFVQDADNLVIWGSNFFELAPGEHRIIPVAFIFGQTKAEIIQNTIAIDNQYEQVFNPQQAVEQFNPQQKPTEFILATAYPNPFNPITTIRYTIPESSPVIVTIYDQLGREVKMLVNQSQSIGEYEIQWDGKDDIGQTLSSGIYFCRVRAEGFSETIKLVLLK